MKHSLFLFILVNMFIFSGCSTSNVAPVAQDTYVVVSSGAGLSDVGVRDSVYRKATRFCEERGLVMVPVELNVQPGRLARNPPRAELKFMALKPNDPRIETLGIGIAGKSSSETNRDARNGEDAYSELLRWEELRQRGVITDEEFEARKARILDD